MRSSYILSLFIVSLIFAVTANAEGFRDTLLTQDGDRIVLSYRVSRSDNSYTILFDGNVRKILGSRNGSLYKNLEEIAVMFFDKRSGFPKDVVFTNMTPEPFMIPQDVSYKQSSDGYFIVQDSPSITFTASERTEIHIPLYLAHHPKKGRYKLFSQSNNLTIKLKTSKASKQPVSESKTLHTTLTSTTEIESDNTDVVKAVESMNTIRNLLLETNELPFSETLIDEISYLRQKKHDITDKDILNEINELLANCDRKKATLQAQATAAQLAKEKELEKLAEERAKAEEQRKEAAQQQKEEEDKRNNLILMIGGVVLAALAFVGNQVLQNRRNARNQKHMEEVQKSMTEKAEKEAKIMARKANANANKKRADVQHRATSAIKNTVQQKGRKKSIPTEI